METYRHTFKNEEDFLELDVDFAKNNNELKGLFAPNISILDNIVDNEVLVNQYCFGQFFSVK